MALLKFQLDCCELTGVTGHLHLHHVVFRSQGGDDVRANIVCMDSDLHDRYHRQDPGVRFMVANHIWRNRPDTLAYLTTKLEGIEPCSLWLERHGIRD